MILADKTCALAIAGAVCAALFARERTGRGQFVEIPMFEQMVAFVLGEHLFGHNFVPPLGPLGYTRVTAPWRRPYKTKDGYLCMMAYTQAHWRKFWSAVGKPEMLERSALRFSIASRAHNVVALYELAGACIADKTTDEWLALLRELEIPAARMSSLDDLFADPQLAATGFFKRATHPSEGEILFTDLPVRFGGASTTAGAPAAAARRAQFRSVARGWLQRGRDRGARRFRRYRGRQRARRKRRSRDFVIARSVARSDPAAARSLWIASRSGLARTSAGCARNILQLHQRSARKSRRA